MRRRLGVLVGIAAFLLPLASLAAPPPVSDSVTVQASVCAPGSVTPVILTPLTGSTVADPIVTVSGTATANQTVTIYRNAVVAGTTIADALGGFTLTVTLNVGSNMLTALSCTTSAGVTVTYTPPTPPSPQPTVRPTPNNGGSGSGQGRGTPNGPRGSNGSGRSSGQGSGAANETSNGDRQGTSEVVINPNPQPPGQGAPIGTFYVLVGPDVLDGSVGQLMELPFAIFGGSGPFTIRTLAGDGSELTVTATDRSLLFRHTYGLTGRFPVTIEITDANGRKAVIQSMIRINGGAPGTGSGSTAAPGSDHSRRALGLIFSLELLVLAALFAVWEYYLRNRSHAK